MKDLPTFGSRLKWLRKKLDATLEDFGLRVGFTYSYLSKLESGANDNPSDQFIGTVCGVYQVRREWLLDGVGKPFDLEYLNRAADAGKVTFPVPIMLDSPEDRAKSLGFFIGCLLLGQNNSDEARMAALVDLLMNPTAFPALDLEAAKVIAEQLHAKFLKRSGVPLRPGDVKGVRFVLANSKIAHDSYEALKQQAAESRAKTDLTDSLIQSSVSLVKDLWPALKRELQQATAKPGSKSILAKFLGVDLIRVSQWLRDGKKGREPGAEYALQMRYWVEHPELQK